MSTKQQRLCKRIANLDTECDRLKAENAELRAILIGMLDCISETRGSNADNAVHNARALLAKVSK